MTLGKKIKQLRSAQEITQPELANAAGIEQSYLSKIENDKAFPSDEIFCKMLGALETPLDEFIQGFEPHYIKSHLVKLTTIEKHNVQFEQRAMKSMMRWIFTSSICVVLGIVGLVSGEQQWLFEPQKIPSHIYESQGVIKHDEPLNLFSRYRQRQSIPHELLERLDYQRVNLAQFSGDQYVETLDNGRRLFSRARRQDHQVSNSINNALSGISLTILLCGIIGLITEPKVRRLRLLR